jgi:hypothetical protein
MNPSGLSMVRLAVSLHPARQPLKFDIAIESGLAAPCTLRVLIVPVSYGQCAPQTAIKYGEDVVVAETRVRIPLGPPLRYCWSFRPRV